MSDQLTFDFLDRDQVSSTGESGLDRWRAERRAAMHALAEKLGLPLEHLVRVDFENGPSLEGFLFLDEEELITPNRRTSHLSVRIGTASFHASEISACIRLD